jgi:hypothetical protein
MKIAATHLLTDSSSSAANQYTTASISPAANNLVILVVHNWRGGSPTVPTVTGVSMTWTQVATLQHPNVFMTFTVFRALAQAPGSGALTIDFGGVTQTACGWSITEFSNVAISGTNGADAIVQCVTTSNNGTQTGITDTLAAFSNTDNGTHGMVFKNTTGAITKGGNFTSLAAQVIETGFYMSSQWANNNQTAVNWTWGSESAAAFAMAMEIRGLQVGGSFLYNIL